MHYLADARRLWPVVEQFLPHNVCNQKRGGRPRISDETVFYRLVLFLRAGCSWEVFDDFLKGSEVSGRTCRRRLKAWEDLGVFEQVCDVLRSELDPGEVAHLDAMFVRSRGGGSDMVGLTRHGKGSKIQAICNEQSLPLIFLMTSANPAESTTTHMLIENETLPTIVVADKAYDSDKLRDAFTAQGSTLLAPHRSTRKRAPRDQEHIGRHYKNRWIVERYFAWLAAWRRLATRWEKNHNRYWQWLCLGTSLIYTRHSFVQKL